MLSRLLARLSFANVVSLAALFFALGGTGVAAQHYLLTSPRQISPAVLQKLRGRTGRRGPVGPAGPRGPAGPSGPQGAPGLATTALASGTTLRGEFLLDESGLSAGSIMGTTISFGGYSLPAPPALSAVDKGGAPTASCPGSSTLPEAAPGTLCFYVTNRSNVLTTGVYTLGPGFTSEDATTGTDGQADRFGTQLYAQLAGAGRGYVEGTWAVTAP